MMEQTTVTLDDTNHLQREQLSSPSSCDAVSMLTTTVSTDFEEICDTNTFILTEVPPLTETRAETPVTDGNTPEPTLHGDTIPFNKPLVPNPTLPRQIESGVVDVIQQEDSRIDQFILGLGQKTPALLRRHILGKKARPTFFINVEIEPQVRNEEELNILTESPKFLYGGTIIAFDITQLRDSPMVGQGNFGVVYDVTLKGSPDVRMAVKRTAYRAANAELTIIKQVCTGECPYVVRYYCALIHPVQSDLCICMEWMDTSMTQFYLAMKSMSALPLSKRGSFVLRAAHSIISALLFMQSKGFIHRDVKPDNMLVNKNAQIKLCDFGISTAFSQTEWGPNTITADAKYLQPFPSKVAIHADMWALGLSLLEIIRGEYPLADVDPNNRHFEIILWDPVVPLTDPEYIQQLVLHLLKKEASERPSSYDSILSEPVFHTVNQVPSADELKFVRLVMSEIHPVGAVDN